MKLMKQIKVMLKSLKPLKRELKKIKDFLALLLQILKNQTQRI